MDNTKKSIFALAFLLIAGAAGLLYLNSGDESTSSGNANSESSNKNSSESGSTNTELDDENLISLVFPTDAQELTGFAPTSFIDHMENQQLAGNESYDGCILNAILIEKATPESVNMAGYQFSVRVSSGTIQDNNECPGGDRNTPSKNVFWGMDDEGKWKSFSLDPDEIPVCETVIEVNIYSELFDKCYVYDGSGKSIADNPLGSFEVN